MNNDNNINLHQANSVRTDDNDYEKKKIVDAVRFGLYAYKDYIKKSIEVVQETGAVKIHIHKETIENELRYYLDIDKLGDKNAKRVEVELFEREVWTVYSEKPNGNRNLNRSLEIKIIDRKEEEKYLILDTNEDLEYIYIKANDYQLRKQMIAVNTLMNQPLNEHTALQKLFDLSHNSKTYFENNIDPLDSDPDWKILTEPKKYEGTEEQQEFVRKALQTKDFALLEGPPGSGKTTAIIELIIQLIKQNKRVLLVSATHVAVDNVIHRILTTYKDECEGLVVPIRISSDIESIRKESVKPYRLQTFTKSTKNKIQNNLRKDLKSKSKKMLYDSLKKEDQPFDDIILKSANLVCGTMIGILQHPNIRKGGIQEMFDVMIVDESSKVTFLDFLVPALYAKKWILVGDVNQLSPYTEDDFINENIDTTLKDDDEKKKLVKSFELKKKLISANSWDKESLKIIFSDTHTENDFPEYVVYELNNYFRPTNENILRLNSADIVICEPTKAYRKIIANYVYVKSMIFEGRIEQTNFQNRQKAFHKKRRYRNNERPYYPFENRNDKSQEWKEMVGSGLSQMYQYRFEPELKKELKEEYDLLVPEEIQNEVENIRKIALPSILEMLQIGIGENERTTKNGEKYKEEKIIYEGFSQFPQITEKKFQSLSYQHRMHDEIANISKEYFYNGKNLITANTVIERSDILSFHKPNESKVIWVSNRDETFRKSGNRGRQENINPTEVRNIKQELESFIDKAKHNPKGNNEKYEIAVITFYREQEQKLKKMLRNLIGQKKHSKHFSTGNVEVTLSTVDKFQGDEADMVLLSFTKFTKKAFYNSPNRLNVALTRAKYKLVLFGNRAWLASNAQLAGLKKLAENYQERIKTN